MFYSDTIKDLLDILDLDLTIIEKKSIKTTYKGQVCFMFDSVLTYKPDKCMHCQCENTNSIIKYGFGSRPAIYLLNDVSNFKTYIKIKKQKFQCQKCHRSFLADSSFLADRRCHITRRVKLAIAGDLTEAVSMSHIARKKHVSPNTVLRVMNDFYEPLEEKHSSLPEVLCFDEFKSVKNVSGCMSFIMMDGASRKLLDIVDNRQLPNLREYFSRYPLKERANVQFVVSDFYSPYKSLMKELLPNARLIIDRFHITQHIGRAFMTQRIYCMKKLKLQGYEGKKRYRHLKKYWKLLQKASDKLDYETRIWRPSFRDHLTENEIVNRLLAYHEDIKNGYDVYQKFLRALQNKDTLEFNELLKEDYSHLSSHYQTVIRTFKKNKDSINLALDYPYSNGPLEGLNNHVKVLKRVAYGFRNFVNFKLRIFLYRGKYFWKPDKPSPIKKEQSEAA